MVFELELSQGLASFSNRKYSENFSVGDVVGFENVMFWSLFSFYPQSSYPYFKGLLKRSWVTLKCSFSPFFSLVLTEDGPKVKFITA